MLREIRKRKGVVMMECLGSNGRTSVWMIAKNGFAVMSADGCENNGYVLYTKNYKSGLGV